MITKFVKTPRKLFSRKCKNRLIYRNSLLYIILSTMTGRSVSHIFSYIENRSLISDLCEQLSVAELVDRAVPRSIPASPRGTARSVRDEAARRRRDRRVRIDRGGRAKDARRRYSCSSSFHIHSYLFFALVTAHKQSTCYF